ELEALRAAGKIGSALQAEVEIHVDGERFPLLNSLGDDLRFVLNTSQAKVVHGSAAIVVRPSDQKKCERCWHYRADIGSDPAHPEICGRCTSNLYGPGEPRTHA